MHKRRVAVVGAAGIAGQQFLAALAGHPWLEVVALVGVRALGRPPIRRDHPRCERSTSLVVSL